MQRSLQQLTRPVLRATTKNVRTSSHKQMRRNFASGPDPNVMVRDLFGLGKRVNNDVFFVGRTFYPIQTTNTFNILYANSMLGSSCWCSSFVGFVSCQSTTSSFGVRRGRGKLEIWGVSLIRVSSTYVVYFN